MLGTMSSRPLSRFACPLLLVLLAACGDPQPGPDAGTDAGSSCGFSPSQNLAFSHQSVGVTVGATRDIALELTRDYICGSLEVEITASPSGTVSGLPASVTFVPGETTRAALQVTGVAEGTTRVTARAVDPGGAERTTEIEVVVTSSSLPACAGDASGTATPGGEVAVSSGTLSGARIAIPAGASRDDIYHVDPFAVSIGCAADQVPTGYLALGPAVSFTTTGAHRLRREIDLAIPIQLSLLPSGAHRGHVEIAYTGPSIDEPRIVGIASPWFEGSAGGGILHFQSPRLGTYQAVVRADAPTTRTREFHFRGILGFSMGGSGSGRIGVGNPDRFDFVAPLGGPTDWLYMLEYMRRYHLGGFCTEQQRSDGMDCSAASSAYAPPREELYEHHQDFEHWWYEDEYDGQGGTFDRSEYIEIFRDLVAMFGNANTDRGPDDTTPNVTPPGTPDSERMRSNAERCGTPIVIAPEPTPGTPDSDPATGFYDDEYNREARHPVITFCDGQQTDVGTWDPTGTPYVPFEVSYAVDVNGNGLRDAGEPVIRNGHEPFSDTGSDGLASAMEPGYDATTNPDPSGDDYDFQFNPTGTENNWEWDTGEAYEDLGLDGVAGTAQVGAGGYDSGEGNGVWDRARGAQRMIDTSPRGLVRRYTDEQLQQFDYFADGGIRDLFNWVVMGHHSTGAFAARGVPVRYYNGHASMHLDGRTRDDEFDFVNVPYEELGRYTMVRYGSPDATEAEKINGDGGHVGTIDQLANRVYSAIRMMDRRWPGGDRVREQDLLCSELSGSCDHINQITIDFESPTTHRVGPASIVLPPGYFDPANADVRYPVVYFLHGYGMEPQDLVALGVLLWNYMNAPSIPEARRIQKMIFVFPDGRCRETGGVSECLNGTFYTDAPESTPGGARMQTWLLDLMEHIDETYRTRGAESIEVVE